MLLLVCLLSFISVSVAIDCSVAANGNAPCNRDHCHCDLDTSRCIVTTCILSGIFTDSPSNADLSLCTFTANGTATPNATLSGFIPPLNNGTLYFSSSVPIVTGSANGTEMKPDTEFALRFKSSGCSASELAYLSSVAAISRSENGSVVTITTGNYTLASLDQTASEVRECSSWSRVDAAFPIKLQNAYDQVCPWRNSTLDPSFSCNDVVPSGSSTSGGAATSATLISSSSSTSSAASASSTSAAVTTAQSTLSSTSSAIQTTSSVIPTSASTTSTTSTTGSTFGSTTATTVADSPAASVVTTAVLVEDSDSDSNAGSPLTQRPASLCAAAAASALLANGKSSWWPAPLLAGLLFEGARAQPVISSQCKIWVELLAQDTPGTQIRFRRFTATIDNKLMEAISINSTRQATIVSPAPAAMV